MSANVLLKFQPHNTDGLIYIRPYVEGEKLEGVTITDYDKSNGSPKKGDMIATPKIGSKVKFLINKKFYEHFSLAISYDELRDQANDK